MLRYPVTLKRDANGTMRVEFPDVPEANTFGEDADEATHRSRGRTRKRPEHVH
jgi:antitoxin HicB